VTSRLRLDTLSSVPELPEVEAVRRELNRHLVGMTIARVRLRRPDLRRPFPRGFARRLRGATVSDLARRGKYLLAELSSNETLLVHLGMSGSFRVGNARIKAEPHDHVVFEMASGVVISFNDPRRFGLMDLVPSAAIARHASIGKLGPEPLSRAFTGASLARACAGRNISLKVALLDQRVVAGVGNIYASDALNLARLSPLQRASTIATPDRRPRPAAHRLAAAVKKVLLRAIDRQTGHLYRSAPFRVYDREGEGCPNRGCPGVIRRVTQAGRSTFFCPVCQRPRTDSRLTRP
jgi:formamidopyrimidine-DNA glycosylase